MSNSLFDKRKDMKVIHEVNKEVKKVFSSVVLVHNSLVIGDNIPTIGVHFAHVNDICTGLFKFKDDSDAVLYNTERLNDLTEAKKNPHKRLIDTIETNDNKLEFRITELDTSLIIGDVVGEIPKKYQETMEIIGNLLPELNNPIELSEKQIVEIHDNNHFVILDTEIDPVRISKQLLPTLKNTKSERSEVYVYTVDTDNKFMFKVIFKVVNKLTTSYHMYMVVKK